jgi:hypothetical protein
VSRMNDVIAAIIDAAERTLDDDERLHDVWCQPHEELREALDKYQGKVSRDG